jgi:hypothetical protein
MGAFREERAIIIKNGYAYDAEFPRSYFSAGLLSVSGQDGATLCFCESLSHFITDIGKNTNGRVCPPLADCTRSLDDVVAHASPIRVGEKRHLPTLRKPVKPNIMRE